jgi:hypothetical protein
MRSFSWKIIVIDIYSIGGGPLVGTGEDLGFNAQESTNKTLTTGPFSNTCEAEEVTPKVEAGVVARLRCLQP